MGALLSLAALLERRAAWRAGGIQVVFTNGCFDLLHAGHVRYLAAARSLGGALVVGLNSDASVRRLKGEGRPVTPGPERAEILCALESVDAVTFFEEETPLALIEALTPDLLVKGGDWTPEAIVGRDHVLAHGGRVVTIPVAEGRSTTALLSRIRSGSA